MFKFLRWLLVPLFPIAGLIIGISLMPERKPLWRTKFDHEITPLGFAEHERYFLVAESKDNIIKSLIAMNILTGKVEHHVGLPAELTQVKKLEFRQAELYDDSHHVFLIPNNLGWVMNEMIVFDWLNQIVVEKYQSNFKNGALNNPTIRGTALATLGNSNKLIIWNILENVPVAVIAFASDRCQCNFGLNETGSLAHVMVEEKGNNRLLLIDVKKQAIVQTIPGTFQEVHWATDGRSFQAIELDLQRSSLFARKFVLGNNGYSPTTTSPCYFGFISEPPFLNRPFITLSHRNYSDPLRLKLMATLGTRFQFLLERLWPVGQVTQLLDKQTGRLLHQFVNTEQGSFNYWPFPNQSGTSLVLSSGNTVVYWDIYPFSRHYPIIGLVVGLITSTWLAWRLLRNRPNPKQPSPILVQ